MASTSPTSNRASKATTKMTAANRQRTELITAVLHDAFAPLMKADAAAFRVKFRKMAADPFAYYRGSACVFYADVTAADDPFADEHSGGIWIHGDLHVENFGTYMNSDGRLVFDVNDFDEAYLGHFTWDLQRFAASLAVLGWQKAIPEDEVRGFVAAYARAYLAQVDDYRQTDDDAHDFGLHLDNTEGPIHAALVQARKMRRADLLDNLTVISDTAVRKFVTGPATRRLPRQERRRVVAAFRQYLDTIPDDKRFNRALFYELRDVVGTTGFGIGSAGFASYSLLVEGQSQALENDVVLSMKMANIPAVSRFVDSADIERYFDHQAHRTVISQRALQAHTDPLLGYTAIDGVGYVVSEVSPYEVDLDWSEVHEPDEIRDLVAQLGRATAKIHCAADSDSDEDLVDFQVEEAIAASVEGRRRELVAWLADFAIEYAATVRADHALFVEAFREGRIGVAAT